MDKPKERWWERLMRGLGGWGMAGFVMWAVATDRWPTDNKLMVAFAAWVVVLGVAIAHSTVFGIVLGHVNRYFALDRVVAFFSRGGRERRVHVDAGFQPFDPDAPRRRADATLTKIERS